MLCQCRFDSSTFMSLFSAAKQEMSQTLKASLAFVLSRFFILSLLVWDSPHYSSTGNTMYVFPVARSVSSEGTCCEEAFLWHSV